MIYKRQLESLEYVTRSFGNCILSKINRRYTGKKTSTKKNLTSIRMFSVTFQPPGDISFHRGSSYI